MSHLCTVKMNSQIKLLNIKKLTQIIVTIFVASGMFFTGCKTPKEKVENTEENVIDANEDLAAENEAFLQEIEEYKKNTNAQIAANEKSIKDFNARIATKKVMPKLLTKKELRN